MSTEPERKRPRRTYVLLLLVCALPYLPSVTHDFAYDDHGQILENAFLRNPMRVRDLVTLQTLDDAAIVNGRRPVALLTYMIDLGLWGRNPVGFHLTNLLLHMGVLVLALVFVRGLTEAADRRRSLLTVLLFGLHPVLTEAVHVPAFRPDVLCTGFILLHLLVARRTVRSYGTPWVLGLLGAAATMLAALASKETGVVALPLLGLVWLCFPRTRPERGTMVALVAIDVLVVAAFAALSAGGAPLQAATGSWNGLSLQPPSNLWTAPWIWLRYLGLLALPYPLIVDRVVEPVAGFFSWRCLAGLSVLVTTASIGITFQRRAPWVALGLGWMLLFFLPVSNLVPLINPMAERYLYGMALGFGIVLAAALNRLPLRACRILVIVLALAWAGTSLVRLRDWRSDTTLWRSTLRHQPNSSRAQTWLALELKTQGKVNEAMAAFERALEMNPRNAAARVNVAIIHGQRGDLERAEEILRETLALRPEYPETYWNLAVDLELQGRGDEKLNVLLEGMRLNPYHLLTRRTVAEHLARAGRLKESLEVVRGTLDIDPADPDSLRAHDVLTRTLRAR
jgi:hypothetical protein